MLKAYIVVPKTADVGDYDGNVNLSTSNPPIFSDLYECFDSEPNFSTHRILEIQFNEDYDVVQAIKASWTGGTYIEYSVSVKKIIDVSFYGQTED